MEPNLAVLTGLWCDTLKTSDGFAFEDFDI